MWAIGWSLIVIVAAPQATVSEADNARWLAAYNSRDTAAFPAMYTKDTGEHTQLSGNTVRIFEHQPDGAWLTKVHIFNLHQ